MVQNVVRTTAKEGGATAPLEDDVQHYDPSINRYGIGRVTRLTKAANDNEHTRTKKKKGASMPISMTSEATTVTPVTAIKRLRNAVAPLVEMGSMPYAFQVIFAIFGLLGLAVMGGLDTSGALSAFDSTIFGTGSSFGQFLFAIGLVGTMICGLILAAVAAPILKVAGGDPISGASLAVLCICTFMHLIPILNLFPVMALWCIFVILYK